MWRKTVNGAIRITEKLRGTWLRIQLWRRLRRAQSTPCSRPDIDLAP